MYLIIYINFLLILLKIKFFACWNCTLIDITLKKIGYNSFMKKVILKCVKSITMVGMIYYFFFFLIYGKVCYCLLHVQRSI